MNKILLTLFLLINFVVSMPVSASEKPPICSSVCDEKHKVGASYVVKNEHFIIREKYPPEGDEPSPKDRLLKRGDKLTITTACPSGDSNGNWLCVANKEAAKGHVHCCGLSKYQEINFVVQDFKPYTECGSDKEPKGDGLELMKQICEKVDPPIRCNFRCTTDWNKDSDSKNLESNQGITFSLERKEGYHVSEPLVKFSYAFFASKDSQNAKSWPVGKVYESLKKLGDKKIGVYGGKSTGTYRYLIGERIMRGDNGLLGLIYNELTTNEVSPPLTTNKVLTLLKDDKVDVIFSNTQVAAAHAKTLGIEICQVSEDFHDDYYIMISDETTDGADIIKRFNQSIKGNEAEIDAFTSKNTVERCK